MAIQRKGTSKKLTFFLVLSSLRLFYPPLWRCQLLKATTVTPNTLQSSANRDTWVEMANLVLPTLKRMVLTSRKKPTTKAIAVDLTLTSMKLEPEKPSTTLQERMGKFLFSLALSIYYNRLKFLQLFSAVFSKFFFNEDIKVCFGKS